jgi:hypothetical protein
LPVDVETSRYRAQLSAPLVGLLGSAFPLSFSKTHMLLDQLLGDAFGGNLGSVPLRGVKPEARMP